MQLKIHPAIKLGQFIKNQRIVAGLTLSEFCKKAKVRSSFMSELECGIGDHLTAALYDKIRDICRVDDEIYIFEELVEATQKSSILEFSDIFMKEDLMPAFPQSWTKANLTKLSKFWDKKLKKKWNSKKRRVIMY